MPIGARRTRRPTPRYPEARKLLSSRRGLAGLGLSSLLAASAPAFADTPDGGAKTAPLTPETVPPQHLGGEAPAPDLAPKPTPPVPPKQKKPEAGNRNPR